MFRVIYHHACRLEQGEGWRSAYYVASFSCQNVLPAIIDHSCCRLVQSGGGVLYVSSLITLLVDLRRQRDDGNGLRIILAY